MIALQVDGFVSSIHVFWVVISDDDTNFQVRGPVLGEHGDGKLQPVDVINQIFGVKELVYAGSQHQEVLVSSWITLRAAASRNRMLRELWYFNDDKGLGDIVLGTP